MLRASIRSVLTGMALNAAFMWRALMQITGRPAVARPSHNQGANSPASMPIRSKPVQSRPGTRQWLPVRSRPCLRARPGLLIDDADRGLFHRNVETDIVLHRCPPQAADARLRRIPTPYKPAWRAPACPSRRSEPPPDYPISLLGGQREIKTDAAQLGGDPATTHHENSRAVRGACPFGARAAAEIAAILAGTPHWIRSRKVVCRDDKRLYTLEDANEHGWTR